MEQLLSLLDALARQYGKVPALLPLLQEEWEALRDELAPEESGGHQSPWLRINHQAGEVICMARRTLLPPTKPSLSLDEPAPEPAEEWEAHPLYPERERPARVTRKEQFAGLGNVVWQSKPRFMVPPKLDFWFKPES